MRDLVYYIATSIDGFIAGPDGDFSKFPNDPAAVAALFNRYPEACPIHLREHFGVTSAPRRFGAVIMGANTHQPAIDAGLTSAYPHLRQYVVTRREFPPDERVEFVQGDVVEFVRNLKLEVGNDIWLCGGSDLAGQLLAEIDEIQVKINPVVFGSGKPLFRSAHDASYWQLVSHELLPGNVVLVTYRRQQTGEP
jgi:dihydrofolate reductase